MKKIIGLIFASSLILAGCNSVTAPAVTAPTVSVTVSDLQKAVVTACGFLPTATTIASIISADPAVATGGQIAALVCKAVTPTVSAKRLKAGKDVQKFVVINNKAVEINGTFVK